MKTEILYAPDVGAKDQIARAGELLKEGKIVAIPTETVYGLAASAYNEEAVKNIFKAKGRPTDNPLIVHIADEGPLSDIAKEIPQNAFICMKAFWPGPFTAIVPKSDKIPYSVSAGLETVAIRMPQHPVARAIIKASGVPLAAPSANLSGSPSPTTARHVIEDLNGRVDAIVSGDDSKVGVESTVVTFATNPPRLLRPGGITVEQLKELLPDLVIDSAVLSEPEKGEKVASPGMKYKHYAPKALVTMVSADSKAFAEYCNKNSEGYDMVLGFEEERNSILLPFESLGHKNDYSLQAELLFSKLREIDEKGYKNVIAHAPEKKGVGLAVYNRLIRAAGFKVIEL